MCDCKCDCQKENKYWIRYSYLDWQDELVENNFFVTTEDFEKWWIEYKDDGDKLLMVVKL